MVVLSAAILTKAGKVLLSRQFVEISRMRIEGLLAAFPKLIGTGKQHTFVETENVRYVYQPMEGLYVLLITNKTSNIIEDLETLRLLSRVIPEYCQTAEESTISEAAFELLFAFDEVLSMGLRENVSLQQIRLYTDMESHEERLANMIRQSKINETQDKMKQKVKALDEQKKEAAKSGRDFVAAGGISSRDNSTPSVLSSSFDIGSHNSSNNMMGAPESTPTSASMNPSGTSAPMSKAPKKGMSLGGKAQKNDLLQSLKAEGDYNPDVASAPVASSAPAAAAPAAVATEKVHVVLEERVSVDLTKEGDLTNMEIKGDLTLNISEAAVAACRIHLATNNAPAGFQFKSHPKVDKNLFSSENILGLSKPDMPFPTDIDVGLLKWRLVTTNEDLVPLHLECWFSNMGSSIEYQLRGEELRNVVIQIPIGSQPKVVRHDGEWEYNGQFLEWRIMTIDKSNESGVLEFESPDVDPYPINVSFSSPRMYSGVRVSNVVLSSGEPTRFSCQSEMHVDRYVIGAE